MDPSTYGLNLPIWMQIFAFVVSAVFAILSILVILIQVVKKPCLKFRLTRELFLRIVDSFGESLFANGVLVSENKGIFVENMTFKLIKVNEPRKTFGLRCQFFGEKVRGQSPISEFNWFSTSPLAFIPLVWPQRLSYLLTQEAYEETIKKLFSEFRTKVIEAHNNLKALPVPSEGDQKVKLIEFAASIQLIINEYTGKIMEQIQIEVGDYELEAEVFYKIKRFIFLKRQQTAKSKIAFKVEDIVRVGLRADLGMLLQTISTNIILNENKPIKSPEYAPIRIVEL